VFAALVKIHLWCVAPRAGAASRVRERFADFVGDRRRSVVAVETECIGHQQQLQDQERDDSEREDPGHSYQVLLILEEVASRLGHVRGSPSGCDVLLRDVARNGCAIRHSDSVGRRARYTWLVSPLHVKLNTASRDMHCSNV
jgi:hypothetical protein